MSRRNNAAGFTLLELLVALSIVAIVMGLCANGFRFGLQVWDRVGARVDYVQEMYAAQRVMRQIIAQAVAPRQDEDEEDEDITATKFYFFGSPARLRLVATAPIYGVNDYLYEYDLKYEPKSNRLQLSHASFSRPDSTEDHDFSVLGEQIERVEFRYFGIDLQTGELKWNTHWRGPRIPLVVSVSVQSERYGEWPLMMIDLKNGAYVLR